MFRQIACAHTYDGYQRLAGGDAGPRALARLLEPAWQEYEQLTGARVVWR